MVNKLLKLLLVLILILIIVVVIVYIINISKNNNAVGELYEFSGVVDETTATSIVIIPDENEDILKSSNKIEVTINGGNYQKGDKVIVRYSGEIAETYPAKVDVISVIKEDYSKALKLYITLIDEIMNQDEGLNEGIEYLSVDTGSFKDPSYKQITNKRYKEINDEDKTKILSYCSKYSSDIREYSLEELKEQDLFNNQTMSLNGMVIYVENIYELSLTKSKIEIVKYVSGDGALFATYTLRYVNDSWKIIDAEYAIS